MILDLLFPNRCLHCHRIIEGSELVCGLCFDQIYFTHHRFDEENVLKQRCQLLFPVEYAAALMQFEAENLSRKIVHQLKYGSRERIGKKLAEWTADRITMPAEPPDLMVTVPLHPRKLKERGYNQLHLFAETLASQYGIPHDAAVVKRNFYKKAQAKKKKAQRSTTSNLFSLAENLQNTHVLLIDDVYTTGNTMSSVAWEILKNPGNKVSVLVIAVDV
ncbi:ComF family protein [Chryseobacterium sp. MFBS3-17]|uniref:ComF family protein n=1 Tax=Chryseobacterium sp. MFBS3-17 TaxID=2886689 RepID=UPI001D0EC686|nr:phosphoribosyltransferase family protein [Chryseobacterium sp. MFBS3-17]MCC2591114.1 double zinc ribbon domain-containing protein [Chryseobacterium sp. MFBS3-17]